jgi:hypothetical protein
VANFFVLTPVSSNALTIIVVEEMERSAPRNIQSINAQSRNLPVRKPRANMMAI